ncbi:Suppressor of G2 allele of SKP1 -like protein [Trichinella papuae]|uniref:Suppressor of G2 allele of SKP1-like protein n=1 Tax=Trichinella papuae TaxID=268474 RepID=A0A0V1N1C0_9BILA|nr:Suppressor of G2 allele of SKP1 -like protein [Trichinella papuae]
MAFTEEFPSVKFDWYQSDETVTVTVKVNDVNKDDLIVKFGLKFLHLKWKQCDTPFMLQLDLSAEIIPDQSHYKVFPNKIELKLRKRNPCYWYALEDAERNSTQASETCGTSSYPTSSVKAAKNWDQIVKQETEEIEKEDSSTLNGFFQKLYDDCDDDQKRAILKSLVESHGTVLSTDWSEVSKRHVDCRPPEGTEWKKF